MKKIITVNLENDSISDLTIDELNRLKQITTTSISLYKKNLKKKKPIQGLLFSSAETNKEIQTTFEKSVLFKYTIFEKEFLFAEQMGIDVFNYYNGVLNWSTKNPSIKRTAKGWIATAKDFMRSDKQKNKLVMIENLPNESPVSTDAMLDYLNM